MFPVKSVSPEVWSKNERQESDGLTSALSRHNTVVSRSDYPRIPEVLPSQKLKKKGGGETLLKLPNDSNTKTPNTWARARTHTSTRAHTLCVCATHIIAGSL